MSLSTSSSSAANGANERTGLLSLSVEEYDDLDESYFEQADSYSRQHRVPSLHAHHQTSESDVRFAEKSKMDNFDKNIGSFASFALIANNISGPGMMSLPQVFWSAGIIPTTLTIIAVCVASSFTGTHFAEAISRVPLNSNFTLNLDYSTAFQLLVDTTFARVAEVVFIGACMIQCSTGIVQASQSLDAFLASYLIGETYALQLFPSVEFVKWSEEHCTPGIDDGDDTATLINCVPFYENGPFIITLGFVLVTLLFLPIGMRNLKETMIVQIVSFLFLCSVMFVFNAEFVINGLRQKVPLFGDNYSTLIGVVLFNFDFVLTLPAWLMEKKSKVNPNRVIWATSSFCSLLYIVFGLLAAMSFGGGSQKMMALLESNEVSVLTRWCAAMFGICIIGAGVPVFSVIIKNTLFATKAAGAQWCFFFGSIFPYCVSWMLYQGQTVTNVLNFAGLVVNGLVAFVFPSILCFYFFRYKSVEEFVEIKKSKSLVRFSSEEELKSEAFMAEALKVETTMPETFKKHKTNHQNALFRTLRPYRMPIIIGVLVMFSCMISGALVLQIYLVIKP